MLNTEQIKKVDEIFEPMEDDRCEVCNINFDVLKFDIKNYISSLLSQQLSKQREEIFRKIKDYNFKENHICRFNDGKQDCDCFIAGLNVALQILDTAKSESEGKE